HDYRKFLVDLGLDAHAFIPTSAKEGENVARASMKMKWYCQANVLEALDLLEPQRPDVDLPLRFCVQDVYRFDGRRIIAGRIETGTLQVGDQLVFSPANKSSNVDMWRRMKTKHRSRRIGFMPISFGLCRNLCELVVFTICVWRHKR